MSQLLKHTLKNVSQENVSQEFFFNKEKKERAPKKKLSFDKTMKVLADAKHPTVNRYNERDIQDIEEQMVKGSIPKQLKEFLLTYGGTTFNADSGKVQIGSASLVKAVLTEEDKLHSGMEQGMFPLVKGKDIWVTCAGASTGSVDQVKRKHGFAFESSETIFPSFGAWLADVVQETYDISTESLNRNYSQEGFWKDLGDGLLAIGAAWAEQAVLINSSPLTDYSTLQIISSDGKGKVLKVRDLVRIIKAADNAVLLSVATSETGSFYNNDKKVVISLLQARNDIVHLQNDKYLMHANAQELASLLARSVNAKIYLDSAFCNDDKSMESLSVEDCVDCNTTNTSNMVTNQPTTNDSDKDKGSFTYDEGKGKKDIVQLTGPLSEVYTRALNIYYAKKPAFDTDSMPEGMSQSDTEALMNSSMIAKTEDAPSQESAQLEDSHMRAVIAAVHSAKLNEEAKDKFEFVNDSIISDIQNSQTDIVAQFTPFEDALKPEVVDAVQTSAEDKDKQIVMVITDNDQFFTKAASTGRKHIDLSENASYNPVFGPKDFDTAIESIYISNGVTVVNGFEGLVNYLNSRTKQ